MKVGARPARELVERADPTGECELADPRLVDHEDVDRRIAEREIARPQIVRRHSSILIGDDLHGNARMRGGKNGSLLAHQIDVCAFETRKRDAQQCVGRGRFACEDAQSEREPEPKCHHANSTLSDRGAVPNALR